MTIMFQQNPYIYDAVHWQKSNLCTRVLFCTNYIMRMRCYAFTHVEIEGKQVATVKVKVDFVVLTIPFIGTNNIILFE